MAKLHFDVEVSQLVQVTLDTDRMDAKFLKEFREVMYPHIDTVEKHAEHLGQMFARGLYDNSSDFVEGYGCLTGMGIDVVVKGAAQMVTASRKRRNHK